MSKTPDHDCEGFLSWRDCDFPLNTDECHHYDDLGCTCAKQSLPKMFGKRCPWLGYMDGKQELREFKKEEIK